MIKNIIVGVANTGTNDLNSSEKLQELMEYELHFNKVFYELVNTAIGHNKWVIDFKQIIPDIPKFYVDIYCTNLHEFNLIKSYIEDNAKDPVLIVLEPYKTFDQFTAGKQS